MSIEHPIFGHFRDFESHGKKERVHQLLLNWAREFGPVFKFRIMNFTEVFVTDASMNRMILNDIDTFVRADAWKEALG
jgi:hypothetical protein